MNRFDSNSGKYAWIWEKYRPVILQMMMASSNGSQEYQLSSHEFVDSNNKKPVGYTFTLRVFQGRTEGGTKSSVAAKDLFSVLKNSNKASALMNESLFEFKMDKNFVLNVSRGDTDPPV